MKIVTIVGARPQFIKAAAVSRVLRKDAEEILIHTGQHYDKNMSDIFFEELNIPRPNYNLGVGSGSHAKQTAEMLVKIEEILIAEKPDYCLTYGDTNSTLAGALAASKLHVPVIHIEAGLRSFNMMMPEEQNRILTDHISNILFCPTETAVENLKKEGIVNDVYCVGDVMCDAVKYYGKLIDKNDKEYFKNRIEYCFSKVDFDEWYLATIHRAENTDDIVKIKGILDAFEELDKKVVFPVHPRTIGMCEELLLKYKYKNIAFIKPISYIDMLFFTKNAVAVITDSGGLQKEAYMLNTRVITVRDQTEWVETLKNNFNVLAKPTKEDILDKVNNTVLLKSEREPYYGNGDAGEKIMTILKEKRK